MVPLNMTCLHCLQHSLFEHLFNLYHLKQARNSISLLNKSLFVSLFRYNKYIYRFNQTH